MKIQSAILLTLSMVLLSCGGKNIDFSYKPAQPRAGQTISFTNLSETGEDWEWSFGDGTSSSSKSPVKTYKQPGTYTVILKVDGKNSLTRVREVTVVDTVPSLGSSIVDSIGLGIFEDVTFHAEVYNPFNYTVSYQWSTGPEFEAQTGTTEAKLTGYFTHAGSYTVQLDVTLDGQTTPIQRTYQVSDKKAEAVLMEADGLIYRQRIYGTRAEQAQTVNYPEASALIAEAGAMQVDVKSRRYTAGTDGLRIAYTDGSYPVTISNEPVSALMIDQADNRIYWAEKSGVKYLPLINTPYNNFTQTPTELNDLSGVTRIAKDSTKR